MPFSQVSQPNLEPGGLRLVERLGSGAQGSVWKAVRPEDGAVFAVKIAAGNRNGNEVRARYRREAAIHASIHHPVVPLTYSVGEQDGFSFIISELVEGQQLANLLTEGSLGIDLALRVGLHVADALGTLHARGIVHRDLQPRNILIENDGRGVRLIDFGLARLDRLETEATFLGTPHYASPEQLGLACQAVDHRSDLYGLGALLYACLTGAPPFPASDLTHLLHQLATRSPAPLREVCPECPPELAHLVHQLLAKDPEERPQDAAEVLTRLAKVAGPPPNHLHPTTPRGPTSFPNTEPEFARIVGRDAELLRIEGNLCTHHNVRICIAGTNGSGKTALVSEAIRRTGHPRVLRGRCTGVTAMGLGPIKEGLLGWLEEARREGPARLTEVEGQIRAAAGEFEGLLACLHPRFRTFLQSNSRPERLDLMPAALARTLAGLAQHGPLALFIADIELADPATLACLEELDEAAAGRPLTLLCTVDPDAPGARDLVRLGFDESIDLRPFDLEQTAALLRAHLGSPPDPALVHLIQQHSAGLPLLALQLVQTLQENGVLTPHWGTWQLDLAALAEVHLPVGVRQLLSRRISEVGTLARRVLETLAHLGGKASLDLLLSALPELELSQLQASLSRAAAARLVATSGRDVFLIHSSLLPSLTERSHLDRQTVLRAAALHLMNREVEGPEAIRAAHYALEALAEAEPAVAAAATIRGLVAAVEGLAWEEAWELSERIEAKGLHHHETPPVRERFHTAAGAAATATRRMGEAGHHFAAALEHATDPVARATLRGRHARATIFCFDTQEGARQLEAAVAELGDNLPSATLKDPASLQANLQLRLKEALGICLRPDTFGAGAPEEATRAATLVALGEIGFLIGYYSRNPLFALQGALLGLVPGHRLGAGRHAAQAYAIVAIVAAMMGERPLGIRFAENALRLAGSVTEPGYRPKIQSYAALALHLCGEVDRALSLQQEVFERWADLLDPTALQNVCIDLSWNYQVRGHTRADLRVSEEALRRLGSRPGPFLDAYACRAEAAAMAASATLGSASLAVARRQAVEGYRATVPADRMIPWLSVNGFQLGYLIEQGETASELDTLVHSHRAWGVPLARSPIHANHFYVNQAWARLEGVLGQSTTPNTNKEELFQQFSAAVAELAAVATIPTLTVHKLVLQAIEAFFRGDIAQAWALHGEAMPLAYAHDHRKGQLELTLLRARILRSSGQPEAAAREVDTALRQARAEGWIPKLRRIQAEFQTKEATPKTSYMVGTNSDPTHSDALLVQARLDGVLALVRASSSVIDPEQAAHIALQESSRLLGAERALLFLVEQNGTLSFHQGQAGDKPLRTPGNYSRSLVDQVLVTGGAVVIASRDDAEQLGGESIFAHDLRSVIAAPLRAADRDIGVLYLENRLARGIFTEEHKGLLEALCAQLSTTLQTARAARLEADLQSEQARRRVAEGIGSLLTRMGESLELAHGAEVLAEALLEELPMAHVRVALSEGGPAVERGILQDQPTILLPMRGRQGPVGVVHLRLPPGEGPALTTCRAMVAQAALSLENAGLFQKVRTLAERDGLTGLLNRRTFFAQASPRLLTCGGAALLFDVDHFKRFNDRYGHAVGDDVLRTVARVAAETVGIDGIIGRHGGEEFAIFLPSASLAAGIHMGERVRHAIATCVVPTEEHGSLQVQVSVGVAAHRGDISLDRLLHSADLALYRAKGEGRNRVCFAEEHQQES